MTSVAVEREANRIVVPYREPTTPPSTRIGSLESQKRKQNWIAYAILFFGALIFLIPFYFLVNASLKTDAEAQAGDFVSPPKSLSALHWSNYPRALGPEKMNFWPALSNTVIVTTLSVLGQIVSCSLVGFGFARFKFRARSILFCFLVESGLHGLRRHVGLRRFLK